MDSIVTELTNISGQAGDIKTAMLAILGVLVTIGIAFLIVKGLQK